MLFFLHLAAYVPLNGRRATQTRTRAATTTLTTADNESPSLSRWLLDAALASPLYKAVLVPQAKSTMVRTAESNGVPWRDALTWIQQQGPWELTTAQDGKVSSDEDSVLIPEYYRRPFHAYEEGNLCWDAAWEGEIASRAVGARNYPAFGADGEEAFRGAFDEALLSIGAACPDGGTIIDFGCGSGVSTRRLATNFPAATSVLGLDLSPHFLAVGRKLLDIAPEGGGALNRPWVNRVDADPRITLSRADVASTGLPDACADVVCLSLVVHELPAAATRDVCAEAFRLLKPDGGQLWLTEMDFDTVFTLRLEPTTWPQPLPSPESRFSLILRSRPCVHRRGSASCAATRCSLRSSARPSRTWTTTPTTRRAAGSCAIWTALDSTRSSSRRPRGGTWPSWRRGATRRGGRARAGG